MADVCLGKTTTLNFSFSIYTTQKHFLGRNASAPNLPKSGELGQCLSSLWAFLRARQAEKL